MKGQIHGGDIYRHPGVLDFSANMNPLGTPESVIRAAGEGLKMICNYPDVRQAALKSALSKYEGVDERELICGNGAAELIFLLAQALRPGRALVLAPTFAEYELALLSVGCSVDHLPLSREEGFALRDADVLCRALGPETKLLCLCNPNNPTGRLIGREMLLEILDRCRDNGTYVLLDECFIDFIDEPEQYTLKPYREKYPNLLLLKAFTKRYSMAGIRLGYGICSDPGLLERMRACVQPWNLSIPAQMAGVAALQEEAYVQKARRLVKRERQRLKAEIASLGMKVFDSQANYIFFRGPLDLVEHCLSRQVLIRDCSNYPGLAEGYYRVAVKKEDENDRLLEALRY